MAFFSLPQLRRRQGLLEGLQELLQELETILPERFAQPQFHRFEIADTL